MLIITPLPSPLHCYITQHFHTLKVQIVQIAVGDCKRYKVSVLSKPFDFSFYRWAAVFLIVLLL